MNHDEKHRRYYIPDPIVRFHDNDASYCSGNCEHIWKRPPEISFRHHCALYEISLENSGPYGMWSVPCDACNQALFEHVSYQKLLEP